MTDVINKHKTCKINGIDFLLKSIENLKTGNKLIITEIPNQGRIIQFFGDKEISGSLIGITNIQNKDKINDILSLKQALFLELPYGEQYRIFIDDNDSHLYNEGLRGVYKIKFSFHCSALSSNLYQLDRFQILKNLTDKAKIDRLQQLQDFFETTALTMATIKNKIDYTIATVQSVINSARLITSQINALQSTMDSISNTVTQLISTPGELVFAFNNAIEQLSNLFEDITDQINGMILLITNNDINTEENVNNLFDANIISTGVENYANLLLLKDFVYDSDVEKYNKDLNTFLTLSDKINNTTIRFNIQSIIDCLRIFLKEKSEFTKKRINYITPIDTSETLLCYQIYNNISNNNIDNLRNWNQFNDYGFIPKNSNIIFYI